MKKLFVVMALAAVVAVGCGDEEPANDFAGAVSEGADALEQGLDAVEEGLDATGEVLEDTLDGDAPSGETRNVGCGFGSETYCPNGDFTGRDFSGVEAVDGSFIGSDFSEARFDGATIREMALMNTRFERASLVGVSITDASFVGAKMAGADFSNATLTEVAFMSTDLTGVSFAGATIRDASFAGATGVDLSGASLCEVVLPAGGGDNSGC